MEFLSILIFCLFWWGVFRFMGWIFNGPRHRARVRRRWRNRQIDDYYYWRYGGRW